MDDMNYAVLRTNPDGGSHFADRLAGLRMAEHVPAIPLVDVGKPMPVSTLTVCGCGAHYVSDPHPPARRQFAVMLQGGLEVTSSQGEVRQLTAGSMILVEDLTGAGHETRTVGDDPYAFVAVSGADSGYGSPRIPRSARCRTPSLAKRRPFAGSKVDDFQAGVHRP